MKRWLSPLAVATTGLMLSGLIWSGGATAQTVVPDVVQIEDPADDANFVNDQDGPVPVPGDHAEGDASTVSDILKVWFSEDADTVSAHIMTQAPGPAVTSIEYRVYANDDCVMFEGLWPGVTNGQNTTYQGPPAASVEDTCAETEAIEGEITGEEVPGGGVITIKVPRAGFPALEAGSVLAAPRATTRLMTGAGGVGYLRAPQADNTLPGTDYTLGSGGGGGGKPKPSGTGPAPTGTPGPQPTATSSPEPKPDPKPKKCKKKKGKAKKPKKCKKKSPQGPKPSPSPTGTPAPSPTPSPTA